jgi:hypothetical protein
VDIEMTAAAAAMATAILEPENLSPMMVSFCLKCAYAMKLPLAQKLALMVAIFRVRR